jgi:hypothetical protein
MEMLHNKCYRFQPRTNEALARIGAIDDDLSQNQVLARLIRAVDHQTCRRLRLVDEALLARYQSRDLSRPEYDAALAAHRQKQRAAVAQPGAAT